MGRWRLVLMLGVIAWSPASVAAQDRVYHYTDRDGREVFTNAGNVAVEGKALEALALPPLGKYDFARAGPAELRALDARVVSKHRMLQAGPSCAALREASERPWPTTLWQQYRTELLCAAGLCLLAYLTFALLRERRLLRLAFAALPLGLSILLSHDVVRELQASAVETQRGLSACDASLPPADDYGPDDVRSRLASVLDLQATLERMQQRREHRLEKVWNQLRR